MGTYADREFGCADAQGEGRIASVHHSGGKPQRAPRGISAAFGKRDHGVVRGTTRYGHDESSPTLPYKDGARPVRTTLEGFDRLNNHAHSTAAAGDTHARRPVRSFSATAHGLRVAGRGQSAGLALEKRAPSHEWLRVQTWPRMLRAGHLCTNPAGRRHAAAPRRRHVETSVLTSGPPQVRVMF